MWSFEAVVDGEVGEGWLGRFEVSMSEVSESQVHSNRETQLHRGIIGRLKCPG